MKVLGIIFTMLGVLGVVSNAYMYGSIKLISMVGSLGFLICGIGFILSYVNFVRLYNITTKDNEKLISRKVV